MIVRRILFFIVAVASFSCGACVILYLTSVGAWFFENSSASAVGEGRQETVFWEASGQVRNEAPAPQCKEMESSSESFGSTVWTDR